MAWREELHPRDDRGRFARKGALPAVSIKATLTNLRLASDDQLFDIFHRISARKKPSIEQLTAIDAELARRDGTAELAEVEPPTENERRTDELVTRGWSYADAYAEVHGLSAKRIAQQQKAALIDRRAGETLETARRRAYREMMALSALQAEEATRGNLLTHPCRSVDPASLWSATPSRANRCASEELKRFWESHGGRPTYAEWKARLGGDHRQRAAAAAGRGAAAGRDFGV
jgi:hypothetical protein